MRHTNWTTWLSIFAAVPIMAVISTAQAADFEPQIQTVSEQQQAKAVDATPFQDVARKHSDAIRACYADALEDDPDLAGRIVLKFTVTSEGEAADVAVESSTIDSEAVANCAVDAVAEWSFPKPAEFGYDSLSVTHPYSLRSN